MRLPPAGTRSFAVLVSRLCLDPVVTSRRVLCRFIPEGYTVQK